MKKLYSILTTLLICGCGQGPGDDTPKPAPIQSVVSYTTDAFGCLKDSNSEVSALYDMGKNRSKTLIWNCADYPGGEANKEYVALLFTSSDYGVCYKAYKTVYKGASDCSSAATFSSDGTPFHLYKATISNFQAIYNGTSVKLSAQITNTGIIPLWFSSEITSDLFNNTYTGQGSIKVDETVSLNPQISVYTTKANTYAAEVKIKNWDGTVLDTQAISFKIP